MGRPQRHPRTQNKGEDFEKKRSPLPCLVFEKVYITRAYLLYIGLATVCVCLHKFPRQPNYLVDNSPAAGRIFLSGALPPRMICHVFACTFLKPLMRAKLQKRSKETMEKPDFRVSNRQKNVSQIVKFDNLRQHVRKNQASKSLLIIGLILFLSI